MRDDTEIFNGIHVTRDKEITHVLLNEEQAKQLLAPQIASRVQKGEPISFGDGPNKCVFESRIQETRT